MSEPHKSIFWLETFFIGSELLKTLISIVVAVLLAIKSDTLVVDILVILFIATRQNILGLIVREQVRYLCYKGKYGDLIVNFFAGYPLFVMGGVEGYAKMHLAHHKYYLKENDPDGVNKSGKEWIFPKTKKEMSFFLLRL